MGMDAPTMDRASVLAAIALAEYCENAQAIYVFAET